MINKLIKQIKENKKKKEEAKKRQVYFQKRINEIMFERTTDLKCQEDDKKTKQYFLDSEKYSKIFK